MTGPSQAGIINLNGVARHPFQLLGSLGYVEQINNQLGLDSAQNIRASCLFQAWLCRTDQET
jgi:hypothetical protein